MIEQHDLAEGRQPLLDIAEIDRCVQNFDGGRRAAGDGGAGACANHHATSGTLAERSEVFERETLISEIRRQNFHMTNVARALGLERSHLYKKCQQLGIDLQAIRKPA